MSSRAELNAWHIYRIMRHASASGHLILWNKKLLTTFARVGEASWNVIITREGRPSCRERPCLSDAWLSCAGSGELAPEIGIFNHN